MCVPGCMERVADTVSRRGLFRAAGTTTVVGAVSAFSPFAAEAAAMSFSRVVDLTHVLSAQFPTFSGRPKFKMKAMYVFERHGWNENQWALLEHTGTHLDAPLHFSGNGPDAAAIPADTLVAPLCIMNIAARAANDPDTQLSADDIRTWEGRNGALPDGAAVAMNSGWDQHVRSDKFRNADAAGVMHFPGFHPDAAALLLERKVVGIVVDTLSLDYGASRDFATHYRWLPAGRWGLEGAANLGQLPEKGATIVVGGPKIEGATGGPSGVFALV